MHPRVVVVRQLGSIKMNRPAKRDGRVVVTDYFQIR